MALPPQSPGRWLHGVRFGAGHASVTYFRSDFQLDVTLELVADAVAAQVGAAVEALGFSNAPPPPPPPPVPQQTDGEFAELMAELGFEL